MSYEDLKERNIFLPEEHWDELDLSSSVNQPLLFSSLAAGVTACVLMAIGGGQTLTWIGGGLFIIFLVSFTFISINGINNQNKTVDEVMNEKED